MFADCFEPYVLHAGGWDTPAKNLEVILTCSGSFISHSQCHRVPESTSLISLKSTAPLSSPDTSAAV